MTGTDFTYAVGRIRVLETRLITDNLLDRMMTAGSNKEALQVLVETEYGAVAHEGDYEVLIENELLRVYQLLQQLAPESETLKVFRFRWDLHNLKLIVGAGGAGKPSRLGNIPWEDLRGMVERADYEQLPVEFQTLLNRPEQAGLLHPADLDKAYYGYGKRVLTGKEGIMRDYWLARLDLTNLRLLARLRKVDAPVDDFIGFMVPDGQVAPEEWLEMYDASLETVIAWLGYKPYYSIVQGGVSTLAELSVLEREIDNYLLERFNRAKWLAQGIEPLVAYLLAKETEAKNLRLIFAGKNNSLPMEMIRGRLRHGYI